MTDEQRPCPGVDPATQFFEHAHAVPGIERGGRLVGHDQLGFGDERRGNKRALTQTTRELVRAAAQLLLGRGHARRCEGVDGARPSRLSARQDSVQAQGVSDLVLEASQGVQPAECVLRHERSAHPAKRGPRGVAVRGCVILAEKNCASQRRSGGYEA